MKYSMIILLAILLSSCGAEETAQAQVEEVSTAINVADILKSNPAVRIGPIESRMIETTVRCAGRIEIPPSEFITVHSKVKGAVDDIFFLPGDRVKKGARLFNITDPELIEKQRLLAETRAELDQAESEYDRQRILNESEATSGRAYEAVTAQRKLLRARFEGLKAELRLIGIDTESLLANEKYQTRVGIYAQAAGYVHDIMVNRGQMVEPQTPLMEMADDDHVHVELQVMAKDVSLLAIDQKVTLHIAQDPTVYTAKIVKINHMLDERTGTLKVHCHIDEEHLKKVKVGMHLLAEIATDPSERTGLPVEAVIKEGESYFGFLVTNGKLEKSLLNNARSNEGFVTFDPVSESEMVTAGAYYIE